MGTDPKNKPPLEVGEALEAIDRIGPFEGDPRDPLTRHAPAASSEAVPRKGGPSMASTRMMALPPNVQATLDLDDAGGAPCKLTKTVTVIGRAQSGADVVLPFNEEASREHAAILYFADEFFLEDLSSQNGTFVNGVRIEHVRLKSGDKIRIGSQILEFHARF